MRGQRNSKGVLCRTVEIKCHVLETTRAVFTNPRARLSMSSSSADYQDLESTYDADRFNHDDSDERDASDLETSWSWDWLRVRRNVSNGSFVPIKCDKCSVRRIWCGDVVSSFRTMGLSEDKSSIFLERSSPSSHELRLTRRRCCSRIWEKQTSLICTWTLFIIFPRQDKRISLSRESAESHKDLFEEKYVESRMICGVAQIERTSDAVGTVCSSSGTRGRVSDAWESKNS